MGNAGTTEGNLLNELAELRRRVAALEASESERKRVEEQLRFQAKLLDSVQESVVATDLESRVTYWSKGAEALVGYSAEETIGKPIALFTRPAIQDNPDSLRQVLQNGSWHEQAWRQRRDGSRYYADSSITLVRDDDGVPVGMMGIERDITEQIQAQEALRASEERYRTLLETISDYAYSFRVEPDGTSVTEWLTEDSFTRLTGYTRTELDVLGAFILFHPDDKARSEQQIQEVRQGKSVQGEYRIITKSGDLRWIRLNRKPVWDVQGNRIVRLYGIAQDITDRKLAEAALKASEERHRIISELISDYAFACEVEPDGSLTFAWITQDSFTRITGYTWQEIAPSSKLYHPDDVERMQQDIDSVLKGKPTYGEYRIITKSGEVRWLFISRFPVWDEGEQRVVRYYGAAQDITERKRTEEALAQERNLLRTLIDHIPDHIYVKDRQSRFLLNNAASLHSLNASRQEDLLGKSDLDLFPREFAERWMAQEQAAMQSDQAIMDVEEFVPWHTDERCWVTESIIPLHDARGEVIGIVGVSRDITQNKRAEQALRASEAKFRSIFEHASDGMRLVDSDGFILDWNRASERITGLTRDEVGGKPIADVLFQLLPVEKQSPETLERMRQRSSQMLKNHSDEPMSQRVIFYGKDGTKRVIDEEVTPIEVEGKVIFCGIIRDVTERAQAEQQRLALALEKKRAEMLGTLTSQLAHDFKTPLTAINTSLYLLEKYTDANKRQQKIDGIKEQVHKLTTLIQDLLVLPSLEREPELRLTPVALNDLIMKIEAEFRPLIERAHLVLNLHLAENLPIISADSMELRRAITNLVGNAVDYTPKGGTITVRTYQQDGTALIEVADTGIGMSAEDITHIFEQFYRSPQAQKISGSGSGLGLVIVKRIVEMHGGSIEVESVLGTGSTFRIRLPLQPRE